MVRLQHSETPKTPLERPSVVNRQDLRRCGVYHGRYTFLCNPIPPPLDLHLGLIPIALLSHPSFRTTVQGFLEQLNQRQDR